MINNPELIRNVLGIIGNITSFFLFASPAPTIWRIWKKKSVAEFKFHPIVAGLMNCIMWIFYSMPFVHPHSILVTTINSIGLVMYICYNIVYLICSDYKKRYKVVKTKSVEFMPLSLSLAGLLNGAIWSAYALIKFDLYILIGNGVGALLGCIQLILYACYYSTTPKKENDVPKQLQVQ
ncbi:Bidirectional sugar transporter SWEET6b, partial [Bienertia sinuspersici]